MVSTYCEATQVHYVDCGESASNTILPSLSSCFIPFRANLQMDNVLISKVEGFCGPWRLVSVYSQWEEMLQVTIFIFFFLSCRGISTLYYLSPVDDQFYYGILIFMDYSFKSLIAGLHHPKIINGTLG